MNKFINTIMLVLMVVGSAVALTTYAQDRLDSIKTETPVAIATKASQLTASETNVIQLELDKRRASTEQDAIAYKEKKAVLIRSYRLTDPRPKPTLL